MQTRPTRNPPDITSLLIILLGLAGFLIVFLLVAIAYLYVSRPSQIAGAAIPPVRSPVLRLYFPAPLILSPYQ